MIRLPRLLNASGNEVRRIRPVRLTIIENITPLSTATMELIEAEQIPNRSYVELFVPGRSAGIFRSRTPGDGFGSTLTQVQLEHAICEVGDSVVTEAINESVISLAAALPLVFAHYKGTRWRLGNISTGGDVVCNIRKGNNVLTAMLGLISQVPSCYMAFDFSTTPWTINIQIRPTTVTAEGRLARNIVSARVQRDDSKLFTRAYLDGLSGGYLDADTVSEYGVIETELPAGDYTAEEAYLVANTYLEQHKRPVVSVQISGVDFSTVTGETLDALETGKLYRLAIAGRDPIEEHITQLTWSSVLDNPSVSINLAAEAETAVKIVHEQAVSQASATATANSRQQNTVTIRSLATGTLAITVSEYSNPTSYTISTGGMSTVNYAVLIAPDNETSLSEVSLAGFTYGISAKEKDSFVATIAIPSGSLAGKDTVLLRWFAIAK